MIIKSAEFVTSAPGIAQCPPDDLPEIAFVGRSNVGKSSLINRLLNRRRLARTSSTPGRTQLLNFFLINGAFRFADLPGYGYARVPASVRRQWGPMIEGYLSGRANLRAIVLIMDIRRTPEAQERYLMDWFRQLQRSCVAVLTKTDKLKRSRLAGRRQAAAAALDCSLQEMVLFSAKSGQGKDDIWCRIQSLLAPAA